MDGYLTELDDTLTEAAAVKNDLEEMMEQAVHISEELVSAVSDQVQEKKSLTVYELPKTPETSKTIENHKIRIHELAKTIGMPTKQLLYLVRDLGIFAPNHMKSLNQAEVKKIKEKLSSEKLSSIKEEQKIHTNIDEKEAECMGDSFIQPIHCNEFANNFNNNFNIDQIKSAHPYLAVRLLYEQGYQIRDIAQILERGQGEIALILNLTEKKKLAK